MNKLPFKLSWQSWYINLGYAVRVGPILLLQTVQKYSVSTEKKVLQSCEFVLGERKKRH